jgi:HSP20 family molecular chaperone IbpA
VLLLPLLLKSNHHKLHQAQSSSNFSSALKNLCSTSILADHTSIEETAADEAARAKEAEEQAALPYKWVQTIGDLDITTEVPGNLRSKDLIVEIKKTKLKVAIKGQEPILEVCIHL